MRRSLLMVCLLAPLISLAQSQPPPQGECQRPPPPFAQKSWVELLLEHRQELALTDVQAGGLERINQALTEKNAPLKETLEQLRPPPPPMGRDMAGPGQGASQGSRPEGMPSEQEMRARFEQVHGLMQQLSDNDDAAYREAEALLSEAQKQTAQALVNTEADAREKHREQMHQHMRERMGR